MGELVKTEKSENNQYQFSVFCNGERGFIIQLRKFKKTRQGAIDFHKFDVMHFTIGEFEYFKNWIKNYKKNK
jgi:hypothetical protein